MRDLLCPYPDPQVAATIVDGQAVIVLASTGQVTVLNEVGSRLWELCDGTHTVADLINMINDEYEVDTDQAGADVNAFLERLLEIQAIIFKECS